MATTITIPDFDFSAFYYPELLEALIRYKRIHCPELTDESDYEPFMQFLKMQALTGHLSNTLVDLVANESTLPTAKLVETVRNMLRLIDYHMSPATPANVDVVYELSKVFNASFKIVSNRAQAATVRQADQPVVHFEALTDLNMDRTDQFSYVIADEDGTFTDHTTKANDQTPGETFTPWATPAAGDAVYFMHKHAMWDKMEFVFDTFAANLEGVWEYYDGEWRKIAPTSVTNMGGYLQFDLTSYLGTDNRAGTKIRVQLNETTSYEELESTWTGTKNIVETTGLLGQTAPSTDPDDYTVGSDWEEIEDLTDGTVGMTEDGELEYVLMQKVDENWIPAVINSSTGYAIRFRIITAVGPTAPVIEYARMDTGKQYVLRSCTQGRTNTEEPLGSSSGLPDQRFQTNQDYFVSGSMDLEVDSEEWTEVDNFLNSRATDKHYRVELGKNDRATVVFGDGVTGKVPPAGVSNIKAVYRYGSNENGNVGANTVTVDKSSLTFVNSIWNPRPGAGWVESEGANQSSLERAKVAGPASLRTKDVALGPDDVEYMTTQFEASDGAKPFSRAKAFEEGFGPKTVELVVVAKGGGQASNAQLEALQEYFNGDRFSSPPKKKRIVQNQEVVVVNFTTRTINIEATVYGDVEEEAITSALSQVLQPEALKDDGVTWEWDFGDEVPTSRIGHEIFDADPDIEKVTLTTPAAPVQLGARELPKVGTISLNIVTS